MNVLDDNLSRPIGKGIIPVRELAKQTGKRQERGRAHLPDLEIIKAYFKFWIEWLSRRLQLASHGVSRVRKVGLPPLLVLFRFVSSTSIPGLTSDRHSEEDVFESRVLRRKFHDANIICNQQSIDARDAFVLHSDVKGL